MPMPAGGWRLVAGDPRLVAGGLRLAAAGVTAAVTDGWMPMRCDENSRLERPNRALQVLQRSDDVIAHITALGALGFRCDFKVADEVE
jgi:hypothetical protein